MPLTGKGEKIKKHMEEEYGHKKGESVFYASANKGNITNVHGKSDDTDDPNAVALFGPFSPRAGQNLIDPEQMQDNLVQGTGELAGEIIQVLPDNVSVASINEANRLLWRSAGGEQS
jgi:hypothetical protein